MSDGLLSLHSGGMRNAQSCAKGARVMKALRWHGPGDLRLDDVPEPVPAADEALVRVLWCGICGSDLDEYRNGPVTTPMQVHPVHVAGEPITLGHEVVGVIAWPAEDGTGPALGEVVVPDVVVGCGKCWWCQRHQEGLCESLIVRGQTEDGGLAGFMVATASSCLIVPAEVEPMHAALVEPLSVAVRALRKLAPIDGTRIAIIGAGTVGQLVLRAALALGAIVDLVVDPVAERRASAVANGALNSVTPDSFETSDFLTLGSRIDAVVECSGARDALALAVRLARRGGRVVAVGLRSTDVGLPLTELVLGERQILGSAAHLWDLDGRPSLDLLKTRRVDVSDLISHVIPLERAIQDGFELLEREPDAVKKVLVDCR